jgi:hypothetical protein
MRVSLKSINNSCLQNLFIYEEQWGRQTVYKYRLFRERKLIKYCRRHMINHVPYFQGVVMFGLLYQQPLKYNEYNYPSWAEWIGWTLALSSILMIPLVALISIIQTPGTFKEVSVSALSTFTLSCIQDFRNNHRD